MSLEKAISIGFRSGEQAGRYRNQQCCRFSRLSDLRLLWVAKLSRMTTVPGYSPGASGVSMEVSNAARSIAPLITQGGDQVVAGQPGDKGLGLPAPERGQAEQALTYRTAPAQPGHVRLHGGFVNEHKAMRLLCHARLAVGQPVMPRLSQVRPLAFLRDQAFFYMTIRPGPTPGGSWTIRPAAHAFRPMHRTTRAG